MYFERKIDSDLDNWLNNSRNNPALIRQCEKMETIHEFARRNKLQ